MTTTVVVAAESEAYNYILDQLRQLLLLTLPA